MSEQPGTITVHGSGGSIEIDARDGGVSVAVRRDHPDADPQEAVQLSRVEGHAVADALRGLLTADDRKVLLDTAETD